MDIKNKIKNLTLFITIIICSLFFVFINNTKAQEADWNQINSDGFGDSKNASVDSIEVFNNYIYASTSYNGGGGAEIYRSANGSSWSRVAANGFSDANNISISSLKSFDGRLYAGTRNANGLEVWRSSNGTSWSAVVATGEAGASYNNGFGDVSNIESLDMEEYNNFLYISIVNGPGAEIWRTSNGNNWSQINANGFSIGETYIHTLEDFSSNLYSGTGMSRGEIWRCDSCNVAGDWDDVVGDGPPSVGGGGGFGDGLISSISILQTFGSNIYAGTDRQIGGGQVWRSSDGTSWSQVETGGFGDGNNVDILSGHVSNGYIYLGTTNSVTGAELWSSNDGSDWEQANDDGFNDSNNTVIRSINDFNSHLYVGTQNSFDGTELWQLNYIPEGSALTASQSDDGDGKVSISFTVSDEEADTLSAQIQYNIGSGWEDPTLSTIDSETTATSGDPSVNNSSVYQLSSISTPAASNTITTIWNSQDDEGSADLSTARIRVRLSDTFSSSDWITSTNFSLDNIAPGAPTLNPVTTPTNISTQTISGSKDANTSILLNGAEIVSVNASTSWSYVMSLLEGRNGISLISRDNSGNSSPAISSSIVLDTTTPNTEADPPSGTYTGILEEVVLSSDEADTTIYYTIDGTDPDLTSDIYSEALEITDNTTLKFFGVDSLNNQETINEEEYVLVDANVQLTKSVSVESSDVAAMPFEFKMTGIISPSISDGYNNLKTIVLKAVNIVKYPNFQLYEKIAQFLLIFLAISVSVLIFLFFSRSIKNLKNNNLKNKFELAFIPHKKIFLSLMIFITLFAFSESMLVLHMLTAADAEVERGDILEYRIDYENIGGENVREVYFVDSIPLFTEYVRGSMIQNGFAITDASDADNGDYNVTWPGHTYFNIGNLAISDSGYVTFQVKVSDVASNGSLVSNRAVGGYNPGEVRIESNTVTNNVSVPSSGGDDGSSDGTSDGSTDSTSSSTSSTSTSTSSTANNSSTEVDGDEDTTNSKDVIIDKFPENDSVTGKTGGETKTDKTDKTGSNEIVEDTNSLLTLSNFIDFNKYVVAPVLGILSLLNLFSTFSLGNISPLFRYIWQLFTEPFLYFSRNKRKKWGVVYDSQTNQPLDLALLRLYDKNTKKLIETKVTDFEGRYIFVVEAGKEFYLEAVKPGYNFPSKVVNKNQTKNDKYYGELISTGEVNDKKEKGFIAYDIPLDVKEGVVHSSDLPNKQLKTNIKNIKDLDNSQVIEENNKILKATKNFKIHRILAYIGPVLGLISFVLSPSWFTFLLLLLHLVMIILFTILAHKKDSRSFGQVFNVDDKDPISKSVVRLFDSKYGRLLATTISKSDGRYGFLAGDNKYLLNSTKEGFIFPQDRVEIVGGKQKFIKEDLGMKKE